MTTLNVIVPPKLLPLTTPARYKVAYGGRGGAKSHFFAEQIILRTYQKTTRVACIREVQSSIKESVKQLLIDKIEKFNLQSQFTILDQEIRNPHNNSLIIFKGMQDYNAANIKSLEGYDIAWVEEAQTLSHGSLRTLRPTLRKPNSEMWFSYNRRHKSDAVDMFFNDPQTCPKNAIVVNINYDDNPFLPQELREEMEHDYRVDPQTAAHVWGGGYEMITTGSYYGKLVAQIEQDKHIGEVPYDPYSDTFAAWDLGISDNTSIWVFQKVKAANNLNANWHFINYYSNWNEGLDHYVSWINSLPYKIKEHYLPHDARQRELQTGQSRVDFLESRKFNVNIVANHRVEDGIAAVRAALPRSYFDADHCEAGLNCLRMYKAEYNEERQVQNIKPTHDWSSHGADAIRYAVMGANILNNDRSDWSRPIVRNLHVVP